MELANFMSAVIVLGIGQIFLTIIDLTHRVGGSGGRSRADLFGGFGGRLLNGIQIETTTKIKAKTLILVVQNLERLLLKGGGNSRSEVVLG